MPRKSASLARFDAAVDFSDDPSARLGLEFNDIDNAERLRRAFGANMLFVEGKGWGVWTGRCFTFDGGDLLARGLAGQLRELVQAEAKAAQRAPVSDIEAQAALVRERTKPPRSGMRFTDIEGARQHRKETRSRELMDWATSCGNRRVVEAALAMLEPKQAVELASLDADPWKLAALNGVIDLRAACADLPEPAAFLDAEEHAAELRRIRAGWRSDHARELRNTRTLGVAYDPAAECPRFVAFLELIMPDPERRGHLLRCLGLLVFGRNWLQVALVFRGGGGNGKSTLLNVIRHVLGGYAVPAKIEMVLAGDNRDAGRATPEEVSLPGARAFLMSEPDPRDVLSAKRIKSLTGGDPRPARALNKPQFVYEPHGVPVIACNTVPKIRDADEGLWRRLQFVEFSAELHKLPQRRDMAEVVAELVAEGPGILNLLLASFADVRERGLRTPQGLTHFAAELRASSDSVRGFFEACIEPAPGQHLTVADAFSSYAAWCEANALTPLSRAWFGRSVVESGLAETIKIKSTRYYRGISLGPDAPQPGSVVTPPSWQGVIAHVGGFRRFERRA